MKKLIAIVLAALTLAGMFAGCGAADADPTAAAGTEAAGVKTVVDGKLTVATSPDFAPMEFVDATKEGQEQYVGFDITLAKYIAEQLGLELVISPMSFDACQTAVQMGTVDMALSGFSWTETRAENYNLSDYYHAGDNEDEQILVTLAGNDGKYDSVEKLSGVKVGAQTASLQESLCQDQLTESEIVVVSDLTTALMQLRNGDFEALAVAKGNGEAMIANNPDIIESGFYFDVDEKYTGNVIMLQKGNDDLTEAVNELLAESESLWNDWYNEAKSIAGVEVSFDDEGNQITE